jgi:hypothetical protein
MNGGSKATPWGLSRTILKIRETIFGYSFLILGVDRFCLDLLYASFVFLKKLELG